MKVWTVNQYKIESADGIVIEFQGAFSSEKKAVKACRHDSYYVTEVTMNEELPDRSCACLPSWIARSVVRVPAFVVPAA